MFNYFVYLCPLDINPQQNDEHRTDSHFDA